MGVKISSLVSHRLHLQVMQLQHHYWHLQDVGAKLAAHLIVTVNAEDNADHARRCVISMIATTPTKSRNTFFYQKYWMMTTKNEIDNEICIV